MQFNTIQCIAALAITILPGSIAHADLDEGDEIVIEGKSQPFDAQWGGIHTFGSQNSFGSQTSFGSRNPHFNPFTNVQVDVFSWELPPPDDNHGRMAITFSHPTFFGMHASIFHDVILRFPDEDPIVSVQALLGGNVWTDGSNIYLRKTFDFGMSGGTEIIEWEQVPAPGSIGVLLAGALVCKRRRRRE